MVVGRIVASALACALALGCQGKVLPLSAQAGSTVLIPLSNPAGNVGYGGTLQPDYQLGTLVYQLDGPGGYELVTRASTRVMAPPSAPLMSDELFGLKEQVISLVDIPEGAPPGTHALHVVRRRVQNGVPVDEPGPAYEGEITILPHEITFDVGGSPYTSVGAPTPFERWACDGSGQNCDWSYAAEQVGWAVPRPVLWLDLGSAVSALELTIQYPAAVIDVADVFEPPQLFATHMASVWFHDSPAAGTLEIGATSATRPFYAIGVAFGLDDGAAAVLDPAAVTVTVEGAWDADGLPVALSTITKSIQ